MQYLDGLCLAQGSSGLGLFHTDFETTSLSTSSALLRASRSWTLSIASLASRSLALVWFGQGEDWLPRPEKDPSMYSTFPSFQTVLFQCPSVDICFLLGVTTCRTAHATHLENSLSKQNLRLLRPCPSPVLCPSRSLSFQTGVPIFPGRARHFVACLTGKGMVFPRSHCPLKTGVPSLPFVLTFYASLLPAASGEFLCWAFSLSLISPR